MFLAAVLLASVAYADDHPEMDAAVNDLQSARSHLQAAAHDYAGHRKTALEHVNKALAEIQAGLKTAGGKEQRLENKEQKIQKRLNNMKEN
jgi:hypothetical protein